MSQQPSARLVTTAPIPRLDSAEPLANGRFGTGVHRPARIPEIDGIRGVAIGLIVGYHVWFNRVSGGVDVFFLLSGFLITMSLLRMAERDGRVRFATFYARVSRRIFPPALFVLIGIVVATVAWLPQSRWRETLGDVVAAALYVVNWRLAENAIDYLASEQPASPVQHYWSLAVQAQFYLVWPLLVAAVALIAARLTLHPRRTLAVVLGAVFVVSLSYSVVRTGTNQAYAYFDAFARIWEFALGGLLLLALPYVKASRRTGLFLGWIGLIALLICGALFDPHQFPGWVALWPTLAAALLVITAGGGGRYGADRLLRTGPLRWLGGLSYALYLWHWPVLICYLAVTDRQVPTLRGGLLIIIGSLVLSVATKAIIEDRVSPPTPRAATIRGSFAVAAAFLAAVLLTTVAWTAFMHHEQRQADVAVQAHWNSGRELGPHPGAAFAAHGGALPEVPYRPGPLQVRDDRAGVLYPGCHQNQQDTDPILCYLGPDNAERTIAVVGGSRVEHWLPALEQLGNEHGWRVVAVTKSACLFSTSRQYGSCDEWNELVLDELASLRPDAVFTTSTRVTRGDEHTPSGYINRWRTLADLEIPVIAIRDVPRPLVDVPDCVEAHGPTSEECGSEITLYGLDQSPDIYQRHGVPDTVSFLDLTDLFCIDGYCPPVIGNVLVYHDNSHLTATYARTAAPFLGEAILGATGW